MHYHADHHHHHHIVKEELMLTHPWFFTLWITPSLWSDGPINLDRYYWYQLNSWWAVLAVGLIFCILETSLFNFFFLFKTLESILSRACHYFAYALLYSKTLAWAKLSLCPSSAAQNMSARYMYTHCPCYHCSQFNLKLATVPASCQCDFPWIIPQTAIGVKKNPLQFLSIEINRTRSNSIWRERLISIMSIPGETRFKHRAS